MPSIKKISSFLSFSILVLVVSAQSIDFSPADPQPQLIDIYSGSSASGDIDGDGDNDLIMTGIDPGKKTALYINDGAGNFTEVEDSPFPNASAGLVFLEDLDGDDDLDLFFSGNGFGIQEFVHTYINDGTGTFMLLPNNGLPPHDDTGMAMADLDGDEDIDLILAVRDASGDFVAEVYMNFGNAQFGPSETTAFTQVEFARVETMDAEGDGDQDILIAGIEDDGSASVRLYLNDGQGNFAEDPSADFMPMQEHDMDAFDSDGDGDQDILMSGMTSGGEVSTFLYLNDGSGAFTLLESADLQNTFAGTNVIADLDLDGDNDLVIIGSQAGGLPNIYSIVYQNQGDNTYAPVDTLGGEYIAHCSVDDFNGDALPDLVIQGFVDNTNVYWNESDPLSTAEELVGDLKIYPNPSHGDVFFDLSATINTTVLIQIFDVAGREVYRQNVGGASLVTLSKKRIGSGFFIARIIDSGSGEVIKQGKFVVK